MDRHGNEAAVIVAGGTGRRLGGLASAGKAGLMVGGVPMLERVCEAVGHIVPRRVVVAAPGQPLPLSCDRPPIEVIRDSSPGSGPLAAVADGLRLLTHTEDGGRFPPADRCLLVPCDLPLIEPRVGRWLLDLLEGERGDGVEWVVPRVAGEPQVLFSAVATSAWAAVQRCLASGRRDLRGLLTMLRVRWVEEPELRAIDPSLVSFRDVDTPRDLETISGVIATETRPHG
jgi:molybdopterin-guanine dinucleotide biosynthesis protein A